MRIVARARSNPIIPVVLLALAMAVALPVRGLGAGALPPLKIDPDAISVSGLSSGGFMAVQFQVAFSATVMGAAVLAGGPYDCAAGDLANAASSCICPTAICRALGPADVARMADETRTRAAAGRIDPTSGLARQRVWVYSGTADRLVHERTTKALLAYYAQFIPAGNVRYERLAGAAHAMPTNSFGNACAHLGDPYINNCHFDAAHALLAWIYGPLHPRSHNRPDGATVEFDQTEFVSSPQADMAKTGWIYVPRACSGGAMCRLHVAFHGCGQSADHEYAGHRFGTTFVEHAGYKETADANNIVVLFPQATISAANPEGCWDWWGYTNSAYANKDGLQMAAVKRMVDRIMQPRR